MGDPEEKRSEPKTWLDLAEFFYKSYKNTSKQKLLEFMAEHEDFENLTQMGQEELAIKYSERLGWSARKQSHSPRIPDLKTSASKRLGLRKCGVIHERQE